jgi:hypothetical protein
MKTLNPGWVSSENGQLFTRSDGWEVSEMTYGEWAVFAPRADNISEHYNSARGAMVYTDRRWPLQRSLEDDGK